MSARAQPAVMLPCLAQLLPFRSFLLSPYTRYRVSYCTLQLVNDEYKVSAASVLERVKRAERGCVSQER